MRQHMGLCTARSYSQRCKQQAVVVVMEEPGEASQKGICTSRCYYEKVEKVQHHCAIAVEMMEKTQ